jgi:hypothetical protein
MRMINRFSLTSYEPAGLRLSTSDYLFKETRNEAKAAMRIVAAIRRNLGITWEQVDMELTSRKDGNWDHPGEVLDLSFLSKKVTHAV